MGASRDNVERVRNALNPLDILREAVPSLKQSGARWKGLCPFHNERTPSFFFMPDKGLWHCFGSCQEGGDVFKFVMRLENLTFPEALRRLADRAGVRIEWEKGGGEQGSRETRERERLLDLLTEAADFYHEALRKQADAEPARRHLAARKIGAAAVETFRLGFAPARNSFFDAALSKGAAIEDLAKAGLAARSEKTGRYHDPLWNRLVFPIYDGYGRVVGFGGRTLEEEGGPKYLNSPETAVYSKSRNLYGLYQGRSSLRTAGRAVVVEGYMDVVGCHQAGLETAVAPLGTALTQEQAELLRRYVQEVVLLFDPDEAGLRASWRGAQVLLQADIFVRVGRVPDGKDPDEFVLESGTRALEDVVARAPDAMDFWLDRVTAKSFTGLHERMAKARELLAVLRGVPNELLKREWLRKVAARLSLDEAAVMREFSRTAPAPAAGRSGAAAAVPSPRTPVRPGPAMSAEEEAVQIMGRHPDLAQGARPELFQDERCRRAVEKIRAGETESLSAEDANWLSGLLVEPKEYADPAAALAKRLRDLESRAAEREMRILEKELVRQRERGAPLDEQTTARYRELARRVKGGGS
ncbi:MAG: DNA primase [Elusimicrobiota bacterium]